MQDLSPFQLWQLEKYGDILPVVVYQGVQTDTWWERELVKEQIENNQV